MQPSFKRIMKYVDHILCLVVFVRPSVRTCENGSGSRIPDELSPVTREVHGHRSKYHVFVFKYEMMMTLALSRDY